MVLIFVSVAVCSPPCLCREFCVEVHYPFMHVCLATALPVSLFVSYARTCCSCLVMAIDSEGSSIGYHRALFSLTFPSLSKSRMTLILGAWSGNKAYKWLLYNSLLVQSF